MAETQRQPRTHLLRWGLAALIFSLAGCSGVARGDGGALPCDGMKRDVVVDLDASRLYLCKGGEAVRSYRIAYGSAGKDKRRQGDKKTPVGTYSLGPSHASKKFGRFIPVGYPTASQRKRGYTGSAIGIHGPDRRFTWAGPLNTLFDWTLGCIAVRSDVVIDRIDAWIKAEKARRIHIVQGATSSVSLLKERRGAAAGEVIDRGIGGHVA